MSLQVLVPLLRSCPQDQDSSAIFVPSCRPDGGFHDVQCAAAVCWCVDAWGQEVTGSRTAAGQPRCPTRCEVRRATALKVKGNMAAGAEIHVPACSEDGDFLPLQCAGSRCFCVDGEGAESSGSPGATVTCETTFSFIPFFIIWYLIVKPEGEQWLSWQEVTH